MTTYQIKGFVTCGSELEAAEKALKGEFDHTIVWVGITKEGVVCRVCKNPPNLRQDFQTGWWWIECEYCQRDKPIDSWKYKSWAIRAWNRKQK